VEKCDVGYEHEWLRVNGAGREFDFFENLSDPRDASIVLF
jgi:hypothetical protein